MLVREKVSIFNWNWKHEWLLMVTKCWRDKKGLISVKFCDTFSPHFSIAAVWKTVSKQVYGRKMFLRMLVTIRIYMVTISPMPGSLYGD